MQYPKVNAHLHTPYSFSAFRDISDALDRAVAEGVKVVGINDFYTTAGFDEWHNGCRDRHLCPLFNIEFISLNEEDRKAGLRVNDPANPGRTYLSGKGLAYPQQLPRPIADQIMNVRREANKQVETMCGELNKLLNRVEAGFTLDFGTITSTLTKGLVRERHLAKALRLKVYELCNENSAAITQLLEKIFGGKALKSPVDDVAAVENEIRGNLLKAGGAAFVPEEPDAFLPMQTVYNIILAAGGIPTYPFLADDANGNYTDFEADIERAALQLTERGFHSVEFISTRNDVHLLEKYASYLYERGFLVTLGSEHNTPAMEPIELFARNHTPLTETLQRINYESACIIAAHQAMLAVNKKGYVDENGKIINDNRERLMQFGHDLITRA